MEEEVKKTKTAEERANDHEAKNLMNMIIAKTFARHTELTEEEYLKEIGFDGSGKTEDEAIRIATFNLLVETTNELLSARQSINQTIALMKLCLMDEGIEEKGENKDE